MKKGKFIIFILSIVIFNCCSTIKAPLGSVPNRKAITTDAYGGWLELRLNSSNDTVAGEFIAANEDSIYIMQNGEVQIYAISNISFARVIIFNTNRGAYVVWTVAGSLFTLSNGNFLWRKDLGWDVGRLRTQQTRLEQVIINLLVNAREALDECEHENKEIWLRTGKLNGRISIELGDNGIGIPESLGNRIFEPYLTTKDVGKGTGLGLSISKSIVVEMGGHIEYFNNKQGGATFLVTFPERGKW